MKKFIALLICLCIAVSLAACGSSPTATGSVTEGNQEEFLKDMAAGINKRLSVNSDTTNMSREQINTLYTKLVQYELDKIEKYDTSAFTDEKFDDLAHTYIEACQMQKRACKYYKNEALYLGIWENARLLRAAIITELYASFDLPISAETAAEYASDKRGNQYSVSVDGLDELNNLLDGGNDVVLNTGDLRITDVSYEFDESSNHEYDHYIIKFTVLNDSPHTLKSISVNFQIVDNNGVIIDTNSAYVNATIASGQKVVAETSVYTKDSGKSFVIVPDGFNYDGNGDHKVYNLTVDTKDISEFTIKIS